MSSHSPLRVSTAPDWAIFIWASPLTGMEKPSSGRSHKPSTRDKPTPWVRFLEECRGNSMNQQPLQIQSSFMGWLQASTGTLGATVSHTGNTLPFSTVGTTHGGASGKGSPRALPHPTLRGWVGKAAKSRQSCLTLCDPIDGSLQGSAIPGILQARTLEWVAISFSNESYSEEIASPTMVLLPEGTAGD